jgi:integrase
MSKRSKSPFVIGDDHHEIKIYTSNSRGGDLHQVCYYENGQRVRKSFTDLPEAKREARMILGRLAGLRVATRNVTSAEIEALVSAQKSLAACGTPLHIAAQEYAEARHLLKSVQLLHAVRRYVEEHDPSTKRKPLAELVKEYVATLRDSALTDHHVATVHSHLKQFERVFSEKFLPDLMPQEIDAWLQGKTNWSSVSRTNVRRALIAFGNWARKRGYLTAERKTVFDAMVNPKLPPTRIEILTPKELQALFAVSIPATTPYLAIAAFAGLRSAEIERLDWKEIQIERGFIEVASEKAKTRSRRLVPISENLAAWLGSCRQASGPVVPYSRVPEAQEFLVGKSKMPWKRNALRHSYISYRLAQMPDTARVALECGNSPDVIFKHYRELVAPAQASEWFSIFPKGHVPAKPKKAAKKAKQPQPLRLLPAPDAVAPEIVGDTGLNDEEIRRALLG